VNYSHVVVGLLFRNLVTRKTHSYYAVELDCCLPVLGSAQTVVGFVVDRSTVSYSPLLQYNGPQLIPLQSARYPTPANNNQAPPHNNCESF